MSCIQAKKLETLGLSRQQAEEMTQYLTEQIILDRLRLSEKFSAKVELEKVRARLVDGPSHPLFRHSLVYMLGRQQRALALRSLWQRMDAHPFRQVCRLHGTAP